MLTERDLAILLALTRYYVLSRPQLQRLCFPADKDGRATRRRLQTLVDSHMVNRGNLLYSHPNGGAPASVYFPSVLGCEYLAEHFDDERFLAVSTIPPIPFHINHWVAVSETHIAFDAAVALQDEARIESWINEYDVVNKEESNPAQRYRLYTLLRESPRLVCTPDAAFLLSMLGHKKVFYLEQDRATSGARDVADSKHKGFAVLAEVGGHRRHFPQATVDTFTVIMVTPTVARRETLRKALRDKPGAALWRFVASPELTPEAFLHEPIFHPCVGEPAPLIRVREENHAQ